jgi:two-component system response regulator FixJ
MMNDLADTTVFVVDDDPLFRRLVERIIELTGARVVTFSSAREFLDQFQPDFTGCLVLDVDMPEMTGLELQQRLHNTNLDLPIIFVSSHDDLSIVSAAFRGGAVDYLHKSKMAEQLPCRITEALQKGLDRQEFVSNRYDVVQRLESLTPRETDVIELMLTGKDIKQIAATFGFSFQSAARHRTKILKKMGVDNCVELANLVNQADVNIVSSS